MPAARLHVAEGSPANRRWLLTQENEKFVGCQASLPNYRSESPDRKVFSLWDDDQAWRIALHDHRSVTSFATARCIFEADLTKRGDDLSC